MAQEDHIQRCSYSGGGGGGDGGNGGGVNSCCSSSRSKKIKKKKLPQRGLGVAQLERIRIEEQQQREANVLANNVIIDSLWPSTNSVQKSLTNNNNFLPSRNSILRPSPEIEILDQSHGIGNWPKLLYNLDIDKQRLDHHGFAFGAQVHLPYESALSIPSVPQRSHQFQQHFSSMANAPSTVLSAQTEPPSNQSFRSNNYDTPLIPEEDKMVGMKRPYPFSLETPQAPSFRCNFPGSNTRSDEFQIEPRNKIHIRDGPSNSSDISRVDGILNVDFLTLAPPSLDSKHKHQEPNQENAGIQIHRLRSMEQLEQQPFCFFPVKLQTDQTSTYLGNGSDEKCETIDLNLKL